MEPTGHVQPATTETFDTLVLTSPGPVLVDFWATWCGPCRRLAPILRDLASEMTGVRFVSIDVDAEPDLAERFGITGIPTLTLFRGGEFVASRTGAAGHAGLRETIDGWLRAAQPAVA